MSGNTAERDLERDRATLATAVRHFPLNVRAWQQALFGIHVALNITRQSPLIERINATEGVSLLDHVGRITAPPKWPTLPIPTDARATLVGTERAFQFSVKQIYRRHRRAGVIAFGPTKTGDSLGVRLLGAGVEVTAVIGDLQVETFHGYARIHLPFNLPTTIACAAIGRPIASIVSHPWLDGSSWPITSVGETTEGWTRITFATGQTEWRRPSPSIDWSSLVPEFN